MDMFWINGNVSSDGHGTHVAGIVGAEGNNGSMVAGVNWNVKLMIIEESTGTTSIVLEAYGYVLDQRKCFIRWSWNPCGRDCRCRRKQW
jgi:hypothetical protein